MTTGVNPWSLPAELTGVVPPAAHGYRAEGRVSLAPVPSPAVATKTERQGVVAGPFPTTKQRRGCLQPAGSTLLVRAGLIARLKPR